MDQIEAPARQVTAAQGPGHPVDRLGQIGAAVAPAQALQHGVIKTLAAQAHPVDPCLEVTDQALLIKAGRIQLQGDFGPCVNPEALLQRIEQLPHLPRCQQGGSTTAQIDRGERWSTGAAGDLPLEQAQIGRDRGRTHLACCAASPIPQGHHGEVAVVAAAVTEGDMEIGAAGRKHGHQHTGQQQCGYRGRPNGRKSGKLPDVERHDTTTGPWWTLSS